MKVRLPRLLLFLVRESSLDFESKSSLLTLLREKAQGKKEGEGSAFYGLGRWQAEEETCKGQRGEEVKKWCQCFYPDPHDFTLDMLLTNEDESTARAVQLSTM